MTGLADKLCAVICEGTANDEWDKRLLAMYERIITLQENCPEWNLLSKERQKYLVLLAIIGVEEVDNTGLH